MQKTPSSKTMMFGLWIENLLLLLRGQRSYSNLLHYLPLSQPERRKYRSVTLRHLDCGSCHGCELSLLRLDNPSIDIEQFNIKFTASPKHAYFLVMTGPLSLNAVEAARATIAQMPVEAVIAFGDCAVNGGIFSKSYAVASRTDAFPDDLVVHSIEGCPPNFLHVRDLLLQV